MSENKKNRRVADPLKTKTGKTRLGPLNKAELEKMIETASKKKHRAMAQRVYDRKFKHLVVAEETPAPESVEPESTSDNIEMAAE